MTTDEIRFLPEGSPAAVVDGPGDFGGKQRRESDSKKDGHPSRGTGGAENCRAHAPSKKSSNQRNKHEGNEREHRRHGDPVSLSEQKILLPLFRDREFRAVGLRVPLQEVEDHRAAGRKAG